MPPRKRAGGHLSRENWETAALALFAQRGLDGVGIEPVARRLGVTKGSGYWHFRDRKALLRAALARWERVATAGALLRLSRVADPRRRFGALLDMAFLDPRARRIEAAIHAAGHDPLVRPFVRRTRDRRLRYLEHQFEEMGVRAAPARHAAFLAYSAYMGLISLEWQMPGRGLPRGEWTRYVRYIEERLLPPPTRAA
jgi:AcrR family transcriptional regulator